MSEQETHVMIVDRFTGEHSGGCAAAVAAFERAVWNVLSHRPQVAESLDAALDAAPDLIAAHALRGFCAVTLARSEAVASARTHLEHARAFALRGASGSEVALVDALGLAVDGRLLRAAARLEFRLEENPHDVLVFKLSHALRFMAGDAKGMLKTTSALQARLSQRTEGYGFFLGCHAFGLEESQSYGQAEKAGRLALEMEPCDAWGAHAVGHVYEMQSMPEAGIAWLERTRPLWTACNNFGGHMAWHLALCHVEQGRFDAALDLYDSTIRATPTEDFRDFANAASLLWRLKQEDTDVGDRWVELAAIAQRRAADTTLVFASLHGLLAALGAHDYRTADRIRANLAKRTQGDDDQASAARAVGAELGAILAGRKSPRCAALLADKLSMIGGSRAQRDIFLRALAESCDDADGARAILGLRGKTADRFERTMRGRLAPANLLQVA